MVTVPTVGLSGEYRVADLVEAATIDAPLALTGNASQAAVPLFAARQDVTDGVLLSGLYDGVHGYRVAVLGREELRRVGESLSRNDEAWLPTGTRALVLGDHLEPQPALRKAVAARRIALLRSPLPAVALVRRLQTVLLRALHGRVTVHGVFMEVTGTGVLLTGPPAIGKSELALELLNRGHRLIADDAPEFELEDDQVVRGFCPPLLRDFLEVRGLGLLNVRVMFGDTALKPSKNLRLVLDLRPLAEYIADDGDRLRGARTARTILGVDLPQITLPVAPGRNLAVLVEAAVRNHLLERSGYDAAGDFIARQSAAIENT